MDAPRPRPPHHSGLMGRPSGDPDGENGRMGEFELLARIRARLPQTGPRGRLGSGDDAPIPVPGGAPAPPVGALGDGGHLRREGSPPARIGHKALPAPPPALAAPG